MSLLLDLLAMSLLLDLAMSLQLDLAMSLLLDLAMSLLLDLAMSLLLDLLAMSLLLDLASLTASSMILIFSPRLTSPSRHSTTVLSQPSPSAASSLILCSPLCHLHLMDSTLLLILLLAFE